MQLANLGIVTKVRSSVINGHMTRCGMLNYFRTMTINIF